MKKLSKRFGWCLLVTALVIPALAMPASAFEAKLSGQVNQMVMWADNGSDSDFFITDNNNSSTRFRFTGEEDFGNVKAGIQMEWEAIRNNSASIDINDNDDGTFSFNDRWLNAYFKTQFGTLEIGKGDGAANNTSEVDLSGTSVISYSNVTANSGGFTWRNGDGTAFGSTIGNTMNNFDGLSRNERLRYNAPTFFGVNLAGSVTNGDAWELAGQYAVEFYGKLAVAAGYVNGRSREDFTQYNASASWLAPFGLNVTAAYGKRNFTSGTKDSRLAAGQSDDATNYYLKVGYLFDIHAVSVEYGMTSDLDNTIRGDATVIGAAYVIKPWAGVELYAAAKNFSFDASDIGDPDDIMQIMAGTRIKF